MGLIIERPISDYPWLKRHFDAMADISKKYGPPGLSIDWDREAMKAIEGNPAYVPYGREK